MERLLSTYLFISRKLTRELISQIGDAGFHGVEIFCSRSHFDYTSKPEIQNITGALADAKLKLTSLHAPTSRDLSATREGGQPLSICEVERVRRIEAMDELKRAIDVAEELPFSRMIFHMGGSRETADPRKRDAAFSSLEHLILHAKHVGVSASHEDGSALSAQLDARPERIALPGQQAEAEEVLATAHLIDEQPHRSVVVGDHHVGGAVVV